MNYGFAFVLIAFGGSLLYKGYKGWTWQQFYATVLQGNPAPASSTTSTSSTASGSGSVQSGSSSSNTQAAKNAAAG
jgi:hypothetical protein